MQNSDSQEYRFETTVPRNGMIRLPEISRFAGRRIDVLITVRQPDNRKDIGGKQTIEQFLDKWTGFLGQSNPDDSKYQYLTEKYQ